MLKKTLQCLEGIHLSQSGALLMLYVDKMINTPFRVLARVVDTLACRRVEMLLAETLQVGGWGLYGGGVCHHGAGHLHDVSHVPPLTEQHSPAAPGRAGQDPGVPSEQRLSSEVKRPCIGCTGSTRVNPHVGGVLTHMSHLPSVGIRGSSLCWTGSGQPLQKILVAQGPRSPRIPWTESLLQPQRRSSPTRYGLPLYLPRCLHWEEARRQSCVVPPCVCITVKVHIHAQCSQTFCLCSAAICSRVSV